VLSIYGRCRELLFWKKNLERYGEDVNRRIYANGSVAIPIPGMSAILREGTSPERLEMLLCLGSRFLAVESIISWEILLELTD